MKKITLFITLILTTSYNAYSANTNPNTEFNGAPSNFASQSSQLYPARPTVNLAQIIEWTENVLNGNYLYWHPGDITDPTITILYLQRLENLAKENIKKIETLYADRLSFPRKRRDLQRREREMPGEITTKCPTHGLDLIFECPTCQDVVKKEWSFYITCPGR